MKTVSTHLKSGDNSGTMGNRTRMLRVKPELSSATPVSPGASHPPVAVHLGGLLWRHPDVQPGLELSEVIVDTCPVQRLQTASRTWGLAAGTGRCLSHVQSAPGATVAPLPAALFIQQAAVTEHQGPVPLAILVGYVPTAAPAPQGNPSPRWVSHFCLDPRQAVKASYCM